MATGFIGKFGSSGSGDGQFVAVDSVSVDNDYIYVVDSQLHRVQIFNRATYAFVGKFGTYGAGNGQFNYPLAVLVDGNYIYVVDSRVQIFNKTTYAFVNKFGTYGAGDGQFDGPTGIAVDASYIYVVDTYNNRVQIFNKTTYAFVGKFGTYGSGNGQFFYASMVYVDSSYIYVTDSENNRVQIFDKTTYAFVGKFGVLGLGNGQLDYPYGIYVDGDYIYVSEMDNHRVQLFNKTTYAFVGKFGTLGAGDGQFFYPYGLDVLAGSLYVCDMVNARVQELGALSAFVPAAPSNLQLTHQYTATTDTALLDSFTKYESITDQTIFGGLWHLNGQTVGIIADGMYIGTQVVSNGKIVLDVGAKVVHIGILYAGRLLTSRFDVTDPEPTHGLIQRIINLVVRVTDSGTFKFGTADDNLETVVVKDFEGDAVDTFTGDIVDKAFPGRFIKDTGVLIVQDLPVPLDINAIITETEVGIK